MRILMVSKACLVGAYQTKLELIANNADLELMVIVPPSWRDPAGTVNLERLHTNGYQLVVDPIRFNGRYHLHYYPRLRRRLREYQPDILHIDEEPYNLATWRAMRAGRSAGCKTLFFSWQNISRKYLWPFTKMESSVLKQADFAIMGNRESVSVWQGKGYKGSYEIIPQFGVSINRFKRQEQRSRRREFVIGTAGRRLVPEKGVGLIIKSVAGLPGSWQLRIAGEGPERQALEQLAADLGIGQRVQFDGLISSEDMPAYLNQLDVLVLASRTMPNWKEQFGRVLIEAMACEVPVIGSDSGEIPNVIGKAGLIFPEDDAETLRKHIQSLMDDEKLRHELSKSGLQRVIAKYTQAKVADKTVAVYRKMMAQDE